MPYREKAIPIKDPPETQAQRIFRYLASPEFSNMVNIASGLKTAKEIVNNNHNFQLLCSLTIPFPLGIRAENQDIINEIFDRINFISKAQIDIKYESKYDVELFSYLLLLNHIDITLISNIIRTSPYNIGPLSFFKFNYAKRAATIIIEISNLFWANKKATDIILKDLIDYFCTGADRITLKKSINDINQQESFKTLLKVSKTNGRILNRIIETVHYVKNDFELFVILNIIQQIDAAKANEAAKSILKSSLKYTLTIEKANEIITSATQKEEMNFIMRGI